MAEQERIFVISTRSGTDLIHSDFFEHQCGALCAVHAAHNAVGSDADPALSREAFCMAADARGREDTGGNYGCDEITDCFSSSQLHDVLCVGVDVESLLAMLRKCGANVCGIIMHQPGHWVALRRCGDEDVDFQPAPLPTPHRCGVADCQGEVGKDKNTT